jgi:signal recognition particle subunit SRP54
MMKEIAALHAAVRRSRRCSSSTRCRARTRSTRRKAFSEALPLTGVVLTKLDGDARGGAALSVRT